MLKIVKWSVIGTAGALLLGALVFGTDMLSYATSSFRMFQGKVKNAIPMEFEIQRARDLLSNLIPELQANVVVVAREEVEVESLEKEIAGQEKAIQLSQAQVKRFRGKLDTLPVSHNLNGNADRNEKIKALACQVENLKLAEKLLEGKRQVLASRRKALKTAINALKEAQLRKVKLEAQIKHLEHQIQLVKLQKNAPEVNVDQSSLVKAEKLVSNLKKRLDVAQRVIASGKLFTEMENEETPEDNLALIDEYLSKDQKGQTPVTPSQTLEDGIAANAGQ